MSMTGKLNGLKQSWSGFWQARNKRERTMLSAAIVVIVVGLFYALLIDPPLSGRENLQKRLPALRQQSAEMQGMAKDAAALSGKPATPAPVLTRQSLEASLTKKGLKPESVSLTGDTAKIQLAAVSFAGTVEWLDEMQRTARVSVTDAVFSALEKPDMVNATLTMRQQRSEAAQ
jgi:general secretion pathway protein M